MALLPIPATTSPGKLKLLYTSGVLQHEVGTNFGDSVDLTVIPPIRTEATALANVVKAVIPNTCTIDAWKITDPAGVTLYEEVFSPAITGTFTPAVGAVQSESASIAANGKGAPAVGFRAGQIKYTIFPNWFSPSYWEGPHVLPALITGWQALIDFLNASTLTGCDFYGSPGQWRSYLDTQINAHYQKRYGL
jgi:hypothetical protein